jgi:hypothetical protein
MKSVRRRRIGSIKITAWVYKCNGIVEVHKLDDRGNLINRPPHRPTHPGSKPRLVAPIAAASFRPEPAFAEKTPELVLMQDAFAAQFEPDAFGGTTSMPDRFEADAFDEFDTFGW